MAALAVAVSLTPFAIAADKAAWKTRNIYFVLTDRIARGSSDNGGDACANLGNYCGGTWKGLQSKLEYIQGMGFDAIWITPVVSSETVIDVRGWHCIDILQMLKVPTTVMQPTIYIL